MELNDAYVQAVDAAMSKAGVYERGAFAVASRIFQDRPPLKEIATYVETLKAQMPAHFASVEPAPVPEAPAVRQSVRDAHFLENIEEIAHGTPAPAVEAPAPLTVLRRDDPQYKRLRLANIERIASGACREE